ncbi:LysR family transcriptional regulator [Thioclava sp. BHET1]|nr:LysR family transcriptional regulator [Thioclava sp. BHET1]
MDRMTELKIFISIADEENLTRAAEALSMSVSRVSRSLTALEQRLGVRLIQRNTRQLSLTSEGERFSQAAREILISMREAEESIKTGTGQPRGTLRVGASLSFSLLHLLPVIDRFKEKYPEIHVHLQTGNRYCDVIESGLDLMVRARPSENDSTVMIRKLADLPRQMAASPDYLAKYGMPRTPEDLARHKMLLYTLSDDWEAPNLTRDGKTTRYPLKGDLTANDSQILRHAALASSGILVQPSYILQSDLEAGRLVPVLPEWSLDPLRLTVAYPSRTFLPLRTRLFIDHLVEYFRQKGLEDIWAQQANVVLPPHSGGEMRYATH